MKEFYPYGIGSNHDLEIEKDFMQWAKGLLDILKQMKNLKRKTKHDVQNLYQLSSIYKSSENSNY